MAFYKFTDIPKTFTTIIENPTLTIVGLDVGNPDVSKINFTNGKYSVNILLKTEKSQYGLILPEVQSVSLDWASGGNNLPLQIWERLAYYECNEEGIYLSER